MSEQIVQVGLYLGLIVMLIMGGGLLLRKLNLNQVTSGGTLKVVSSLSLGVKEKLVLVQAGDRQLLIGVTPNQISRLEVFDEPIITAAPEAGAEPFKDKLQELLGAQQHDQKATPKAMRNATREQP